MLREYNRLLRYTWCWWDRQDRGESTVLWLGPF